MSTRRKVGPRIKPTSKRTVQDFEKAVLFRDSIFRTQNKDNPAAKGILEEAEEKLFNARFSLYELIQQLETTASIKLEVQH
jgi:predicted metal-dependent HD superfamily phosphohydrolase